MTNSDGCTSAAAASITINAAPETPATPIVADTTQPTCAIATGSVVLSGLPAGNWTINPGNISGNTESTTISGLTAGTYTYTVTNSDGCTSAAAASIAINAAPDNPVVIINNDDADCNNDDEVRFDLNSYLPQDIPADGTWVDFDNSGALIGSEFSPYLLDVGTYKFTYETVDQGGCLRKVELNMAVDDDCTVLPECSPILVHNAFSPNGDGVNEVFVIEQLDQFNCYPTNTVEIYNRWGVLVYDTKQYDNNNRAFKGISEGRATIAKGEELPTGTYFYVIEYTDAEGNNNHKEGYLFLNQ